MDIAWGDLNDSHHGWRLVLRFPWSPDVESTFTDEAPIGPGSAQPVRYEQNRPVEYADTYVHDLVWDDGSTGPVQMLSDMMVTVTEPATQEAAP
jgi:hypothetical protein